MNDEIEDIKRRIDIVEFIGSYVTLKKAGTNYKGLCPFHNEKTPSMMVSPEKQIFKCFGCNEGGDVFSFLMKIEALGFGDALKTLAAKAGVTLKPRHFEKLTPGEQPGQKSRLIELNELAAKLFHKVLVDHPKAVKAREYLEGRGITPETINSFNLGYAPNSWDFLIRFAESHGYTEKELLAAGLAVRKNQIDSNSGNRQSYDRFRGRITFPICNVLGSTVAFTGRDLEDRENSPKYLNSSESPVYHKSLIIYGLDKAKFDIKKTDQVIIVEGQMDVVACHQAGFKNVVATSGTSLTKEMLMTLSRYTFNIYFCFDGDSAGQLALKRAISMAGELDLSCKVVIISGDFKDPDEAIKADPKNWTTAVENAKPALEYLIDLSSLALKDVNDKRGVQKEILPLIKLLKSETEKEYYIKYLATRLLVTEQSLMEELKRAKSSEYSSQKTENSQKGIEEVEEIGVQEKLLAVLLENPAVFKDQLEKAIGLLKPTGEFEKLIIKLQLLDPINEKTVGEILKQTVKKDRLKEIWLELSSELDDPDQGIFELAQDLFNNLKKASLEYCKADILSKISQADAAGDKKKRLELLKELNSVIINQDK